jgi:hypothetical protein
MCGAGLYPDQDVSVAAADPAADPQTRAAAAALLEQLARHHQQLAAVTLRWPSSWLTTPTCSSCATPRRRWHDHRVLAYGSD